MHFPRPFRISPRALRILLALFTALPALAAAQDPVDPEVETTQAKVQSTWIWQEKPGFQAAYSGQNSLLATREKAYTFTATAFFGLRVWEGGEVYLDPEVSQGVPLSNLNGLGGFTNGEATRASGPHPTLYLQRLFLRQTWGLGGGHEHVESDQNQMAGWVDKNRVVLTMGNFSLEDVFDGNSYAKDPRTQFLNWSNMSYLAYDYAADARGFGWGFAGEWYQGDWTFRFGRMTGPKDPNMLPVDFVIGKHYGDQVEIEHAHELAGQPGKLRLLAWRNRARLASFADALAYGQSVDWVPDPLHGRQYIFNVRSGEKIKYGLGVSAEQAVGDDLGLFFRGMKADGHTETWAFAEADASLSMGGLLKGKAWGRSRDTAGLALARNMLSKDRRDYLAAGGISFFIGDGRLNYRPEDVAEVFYNWNVAAHLWLTADYQHIRNPACNADRGPADASSIRVHMEF